MLDLNLNVDVLGQTDVEDFLCDFEKNCTLEDSFTVALDRWIDVFVNEGRSGYYSIDVVDGNTWIYSIDNFGVRIDEEFKDQLEPLINDLIETSYEEIEFEIPKQSF